VKIASAFCLLFAINAFALVADNEENLSKILDQLNIALEDRIIAYTDDEIVPYNKRTSIVAIVKERFGPQTLYVLIIDNSTLKILSKFQEDIDRSFRVQLSEINKEKYRLDDQTRAFGVRTVGYMAGASDFGYESEYFSLFIIKNGVLERVLKDLPIWRRNWVRQENKKSKACSDYIDVSSLSSTLSISNEKTNGFYDIIVNNKETTAVDYSEDGGYTYYACEGKKTRLNKPKLFLSLTAKRIKNKNNRA
jgi:hypothetical protein